jgi:hypothetical protein
MRSARLAIALIAVGYVLFIAAGVGFAEQKSFSLAPRQSVAVGQYTVTYVGLTSSGWPAYALSLQGGGTLAAFPPNPLPATCCDYLFGNVLITTTAIAPGGATVAGVITLR